MCIDLNVRESNKVSSRKEDKQRKVLSIREIRKSKR